MREEIRKVYILTSGTVPNQHKYTIIDLIDIILYLILKIRFRLTFLSSLINCMTQFVSKYYQK
jgi:hypothetical protein